MRLGGKVIGGKEKKGNERGEVRRGGKRRGKATKEERGEMFSEEVMIKEEELCNVT